MTRPTSDFISLKDGPTLPIEAIVLALDLEARGFQFERVEADVYRVAVKRLSENDQGDLPMLTEEDKANISKWKMHLRAICDYVSRGENSKRERERSENKTRTRERFR